MSHARAAGPTVRIGTRGSALALAQARLAADALAGAGAVGELVLVETAGDRRAPDTAWGEGAFVKAIEQALLDGRIEMAVHSAKDVPTEEEPRLEICAYLPREEPLDALVVASGSRNGVTLDTLPAGSTIGTDSPRRAGFLRSVRPDLRVRPLHGNVDTRLQRLDSGEVDALVLAVAGLVRLGRADRIAQRLPHALVPPAPGQGAIALQVRSGDDEMVRLGSSLDHRPTRQAVEAERGFLRAAGGGCRAPIGALAIVDGGRLRLHGGFTTGDGQLAVFEEVDGPADDGADLAAHLAQRLTERRQAVLAGPRLLLTRPLEGSRRLAARLAEHGLRASIVPAIEVRPVEAEPALEAALRQLGEYERVVVTSANGARALAAAAARLGLDLRAGRWAAVGAATALALRQAGARDLWLPSSAGAEHIAAELPLHGGRILLARGDLADDRLSAALRERGVRVEQQIVYRTVEAPASSSGLLREALDDGAPAAVIFASPSAVRGLLALAAADSRAAILTVPAICIGPTTAAAARDAGFTILGRAATQDADELARLAAELLAPWRAGMTA